MTLPGIGTYDVVGNVVGNQITFLFAAVGPGYGVGDLKLTVKPGAGSGTAGTSNFGPGGAGVGFGTTQITLTGSFEDSVNGTLSRRAIQLTGYAGYDPVDTGDDRGTPSTPTATGTPATNPSLVGTYTGNLLLATFTDDQYAAGAFTGFSRLGAGDNGVVATNVPLTLTISTQTNNNLLTGSVTIPGQGTFAVAGDVVGNQTTFLLGGAPPAPPPASPASAPAAAPGNSSSPRAPSAVSPPPAPPPPGT